MYFLAEYTNETYLHIGQFFDRDHTTVMHGKDLVNDFIKVDVDRRNEIEAIKQKIIDNHV